MTGDSRRCLTREEGGGIFVAFYATSNYAMCARRKNHLGGK